MKNKLFFMTVLGVITAGMLSAQGWSNSGTLTINGNMPVITQVSVNDLAITLNLESATSNVVLAQLLERSNSASGYTVTVTSANGGELVGTALGESLPYALTIGSTALDLTAGPALVTDSLLRTTATGVSRDVVISHGSGNAGGLLLAQDSYTDVLTFEIAPK